MAQMGITPQQLLFMQAQNVKTDSGIGAQEYEDIMKAIKKPEVKQRSMNEELMRGLIPALTTVVGRLVGGYEGAASGANAGLTSYKGLIEEEDSRLQNDLKERQLAANTLTTLGMMGFKRKNLESDLVKEAAGVTAEQQKQDKENEEKMRRLYLEEQERMKRLNAEEQGRNKRADWEIKADKDIAMLNAIAKKAQKEASKLGIMDKVAAKQAEKIATLSAQRASMANQMETLAKQLPGMSRDQAVKAGQGILKVMNSTMGADAVGMEEARRLGSFLEFQVFNVTEPGAFIGRSLPEFQKQLQNSVQTLRQTNAADFATLQNLSSPGGGKTFIGQKSKIQQAAEAQGISVEEMKKRLRERKARGGK